MSARIREYAAKMSRDPALRKGISPAYAAALGRGVAHFLDELDVRLRALEAGQPAAKHVTRGYRVGDVYRDGDDLFRCVAVNAQPGEKSRWRLVA